MSNSGQEAQTPEQMIVHDAVIEYGDREAIASTAQGLVARALIAAISWPHVDGWALILWWLLSSVPVVARAVMIYRWGASIPHGRPGRQLTTYEVAFRLLHDAIAVGWGTLPLLQLTSTGGPVFPWIAAMAVTSMATMSILGANASSAFNRRSSRLVFAVAYACCLVQLQVSIVLLLSLYILGAEGRIRASTNMIDKVSAARVTSEAVADELARAAARDSLTGLLNRSGLATELDELLSSVGADTSVTGVFIDLDHFKLVNDELGHGSGDDVLRRFAAGLEGLFRQDDLVCRLGGDEFFAVLSSNANDARIEELAPRILEVAVTSSDAACSVPLSASVGATSMPASEASLERLLKEADQAMYSAKGGGKNAFRHFSVSH